MLPVAGRLGVIAGRGELPEKIIEACKRLRRDYFILAIEGETSRGLVQNSSHAWVKLGAIGAAIKILKSEGVNHLVLAGKINKPNFTTLGLDFVGAKLLARIGSSKLAGDNAILSKIVSYLEEQGFKVVGVENVLADLLAPKGVITRLKPDEQALADIKLGFKIAKAIGELDIGQAIVIQKGRVLAVEAAEGTDTMISRVADLTIDNVKPVLIKVIKPNQESRVDLPTIGVQTVENANKVGIGGIAVETGASIIIDRDKVAELADSYGMFVTGVSEEG
jgi:hypothetical protein